MVLGGVGATVALPWLESSKLFGIDSKITSPKRFGFLFWGDGIHPPEWWSKGQGESMELGPAFKSLESVKGKVNFVHGLQHPGMFAVVMRKERRESCPEFAPWEAVT